MDRTRLLGPARFRWLLVLVLLATVAVACNGAEDTAAPEPDAADPPDVDEGEPEPEDDAWADVIAAAQAEGTVVYQNTASDAVNPAVVEQFEAEYGIEVIAERVSGTEMIQRFGAEAATGSVSADLLILSGPTEAVAADWLAEGWVSSLPAEGLPVLEDGDFPDELLRENSAVAFIMPWGYWYNTETVTGDDIPTGWEDLADPKWEGELLVADVSVSDSYLDLYSMLLHNYGEEWFEAFRANRSQLIPGGIQMIEALGAGEGRITSPAGAQSHVALRDQGAPVEVVVPEDNVGIEFQVVLPSPEVAEHPNAGRLLANWLLTRDGAEALTETEYLYHPYNYRDHLPDYNAPDPEQAQADKERIYELFGV